MSPWGMCHHEAVRVFQVPRLPIQPLEGLLCSPGLKGLPGALRGSLRVAPLTFNSCSLSSYSLPSLPWNHVCLAHGGILAPNAGSGRAVYPKYWTGITSSCTRLCYQDRWSHATSTNNSQISTASNIRGLFHFHCVCPTPLGWSPHSYFKTQSKKPVPFRRLLVW